MSWIKRIADDLRKRHPDTAQLDAVEADPGGVYLRRKHWPEGITIFARGSASSARQVEPGQPIPIGYLNGDRNLPQVIGRRVFYGARPAKKTPIVFDVVAWLQANQGAGQNAVGGRLNASLLDPRNSTSNWTLPTSTETGVTHVGLQALGLARARIPVRNWEWGDLAEGSEKVDVYLTAWPRQDAEGSTGLCIGAWRVSDRVNLWIAQPGSSGSPWENSAYPRQARFFADPLSGFAHALPDPVSSSPNRIVSAAAHWKYHESPISRAATGGLNLANVSLHSFLATVGEGEEAHLELQSYFFCPAHPATASTGAASVDFLVMNQESGQWDSLSSRDVAELPEGGYAAISDVVEYGSEGGAPAAWRGSEALAVVTGGVQDPLFDTWSKAHWTVRSLKPTDATDGALLVSVTLEAVANPTELSQASLKTQIAAVEHPVQWIDSFPYSVGFWRGGLTIDHTTSKPEWAIFQHPPILLPYATPNTARLGTVASRLTSVWPPAKKNCGGGVVVDTDSSGGKHVAFCVAMPDQFLYAKGYGLTPLPSYEDPYLDSYEGEMLQTYLWHWREANHCNGNTLTDDQYSLTPTVPHGSMPTLSPGIENGLSETEFCENIGYTDPEVFGRTRERSYWVEDEGTHKQIKNTWVQQVGCTYRTRLVIIAPDGTKREADISQLLDATHSITARGSTNYVGGGAPTTISGTEADFPAPNNVWQLALFVDKGLIAVLRDLHADGANNNPSPHLEIWNIGDGDTITKLSTVRLGSYTEKFVTDTFPNWWAGDQLWNPYAFGGPRMKCCLDASGNPQIFVLVGEDKKVDTDTESQFKRVCYALVDLADPSDPEVLRHALTSPDEGVGNSGDVPSDWPLWWELDSLILTAGHVAWIKDSLFRESIAA